MKEEVKPDEPLAFIERITPPGVKSNLILADGLKIILNSNSKLKFQRQFDPVKREVFLEGEAIFLLENCNGVKIHISNRPKGKVTLSDKFQDETLENVLLGLSYVAGFKFSTHKNDVEIMFNN